MNKADIMRLANRLVLELQDNSDMDFVDRVLMYVGGGETFTMYEIAVNDVPEVDAE